jgi:hypothetical protein
MKRVLFVGIPLVALVLAVGPVAAQNQKMTGETKTARGTVTAMSADSITVKVQDKDMKFNVDGKTRVIAAGAGTKSRQAKGRGMTGPALADVVKTGEAVEVRYHDMGGGTLHAASIRKVASAGGGAMSEEKPAAKTATGTVKSVSADSLTLSDGGKDMTFTIDKSTNVVGRGVGTKAAPTGGKAPITDLVSVSDKVSVTYHEMGSTMHASTVRVMGKGTKSTTR